MRTILLAIAPAALGLVLTMSTTTRLQAQPPDTLIGQVAAIASLPASSGQGITTRQILKGATHDLSQLNIKSITLDTGIVVTGYGSDAEELIIVKEGRLDVSADESGKLLGPGGVAFFRARSKYSLENAGKEPVTYYILRMKGRSNAAPTAEGPILLEWADLPVKTSLKGESRQIFTESGLTLAEVDMHATTLEKGQVSHPPHTHRSEEIILMRSGNVQEWIGDKYHSAAPGDVIFLPSGVPHALENKGSGRCEYYALQWK